MIKAVVLDLDGTLLGSDHKITEINKKTLKKLMTQGIEVFIATGRSYDAMREYHEELNLETPAICYNGAKIAYKDGRVEEFLIEGEEFEELVKIGRETETHLNLYQDEVWKVENSKNQETKDYIEVSGLQPKEANFDTLEKRYTTKGLYIGDHEKLLKLEEIVKERLKDKIHTTFSKPYFLEILKGDSNKGTTMERILKGYNIELKDAIAFGDGLNDIEMLEAAGIGVAMANSFEELKKIADDITDSNDESGVGNYLKRYER